VTDRRNCASVIYYVHTLPLMLLLHNRYDKRSLGPAGLLGWQNYTMTPAELRDQMYRTFNLKPTAAQLGAIVHMFGTTTTTSTSSNTGTSSSVFNGVDSGGSAADATATTASAAAAAATRSVAQHDNSVTGDSNIISAAVVVVKVPDFLNSFFKVSRVISSSGCESA
jgi:hypothetical protein